MITRNTNSSRYILAAVLLATPLSAQTPAFDPVHALEQAVQLADIQNDPASAKAFLEKLTGPEIPAVIRDQAKARLAKMNPQKTPVIELNLAPGVKEFRGSLTDGKLTGTTTMDDGSRGVINEKTVRISSTPLAPSPEKRIEEAMATLLNAGAKDRGLLVDAAIQGMAKSMGKNAEFISETTLKTFNRTMDRSVDLVGIGAILTGNERFIVGDIVASSPAEKGGLMRGAEILGVDGKTPFGLGGKLEDVVAAIRGPAGSKVKIQVKAPDGTTRDLEITRARIDLPVVPCCQPFVDEQQGSRNGWWLDKQAGIAGVAMGNFGAGSAEELKKILSEPELKANLRGLIIDLRNNGGGGFTEVVWVADMFVNHGVLVTIKRNDTMDHKEAGLHKFASGVPIVVLVNEATAAGAEVLAAALQDHHRATILGQRTFGRGEIMTIASLKGGGAIKYPAFEMLRPNGKSLEKRLGMTDKDEWGIIPDKQIPKDTPTAGWVAAAMTELKSRNGNK